MTLKLESAEHKLLLAVCALLLFALLGPAISQPVHQHDFADQRFFGYFPNAADVLSNLPFALWGLAGLVTLPSVKLHRTNFGLCTLFFFGLILTAFASGWYHLAPNNVGLAIDRWGMVFAFAGLIGLAVVDRVSIRAGASLCWLVLLSGAFSVWSWSLSGNVLPWLVLQFGGMVLVLCLTTRQPVHGALAVNWATVILIYAIAKVFELADHAVHDLTSHIISGHSLKHIVASFAAWPIISALRSQAKSQTNSN